VRTVTVGFLLHYEFMDAIPYGYRLLDTGKGLQYRGLHRQLDGDGFGCTNDSDSVKNLFDETATEGMLPINQHNEQSNTRVCDR
jgi:hypothetical protein